jgi:hypothetical protein
MANDYYQIYNHAYSFSSSTVNSGGLTYSLPQNDYGIYGQHVDAFFNTISRNAGATGSLAVWFVSDKGLTFYTHSLGATAAITGYVQGRFPVTASTTGLGLIDLRGSPDWTKIVGDGIVGPTRGSTGSVAGANATQYVNGIKAVFGVLKNQYPNIDWAIAGLPHIPYVMAYAPPVGQSPVWDASLTNSGGYTAPAWWDPEHPTGSSAADFYSWMNAPQELREFYQKVVTDGIQEMVFDNCAVDWLCPDIRVPYTDSLPFYEYGNDSDSNYNRNKKLCELSSAKARSLLVRNYPLLSTMYPSRPLTRYDDPESQYTVTEQVAGNEYIDIDGSSYEGVTANASEGYYSSLTYRYDMLQAAIDGNSDGFIFFDPMPSVVEIACTGDISVGATGYDAQIRARNMFSSMMYGGTYEDGYVPSGSGYADPCVKVELLRFTSKRTVGYLDDIRESVNLAGYGNPDQGNGNGWIRGATKPIQTSTTYDITDTTNRSSSDLTYGEQYWTQKVLGGVDCDCGGGGPCDGTNNPYSTQGGALGCCCIQVETDQGGIDNNCECPNIRITSTPVNSPACNDSAPPTCPCTPYQIDVTSIVNNDCAGSTCKRQVNVINGCNCVTLFNPPGGLNEGTSTGLACICAHTNEFTVTQPCGGFQFTVTEGAESTWKEIDYALILDMRTYKRSSFDTRTFLLVRDSGEKYSNWSAIYEGILMRSRYSAFIQAGDTILKPTVSAAALRTQSNKEVLRHLPNQYFTT